MFAGFFFSAAATSLCESAYGFTSSLPNFPKRRPFPDETCGTAAGGGDTRNVIARSARGSDLSRVQNVETV